MEGHLYALVCPLWPILAIAILQQDFGAYTQTITIFGYKRS